MTIHHFVIDLVSWRIIWEDLEQLLQGKECGYKSMSFMQWSYMLDEYAQSLDIDMWPIQDISEPLISDMSLLEQNTLQSTKSLSFKLTPSQTEQLFGKANIPFQTEATDLMISSLVIAYCSVFNLSAMTLGIEGHGREPWREDIDISRTIGWFTTIYPMVVNANEMEDPLTILKRVKDLRKIIPGNGIIYGLLRDLKLYQENPPKKDIIQIVFNYSGRFQQLENQNSFFQPVEAPFDFDIGDVDLQWRRNQVFDILAGVNQNSFEASILFSTSLHSEDIVSQWLLKWQQVLNTMISQCTQLNVIEHTRSDFPLLKLSESNFNVLYNETLLEAGVDPSLIEDILPCTHLQEGLIAGMLKSSDYYHVQQTFDIVGDFDQRKFKEAWQTVIHDHHILRSVFVQNPVMNESSVAFFQVVIRDYTPQWLHINCTEDSIAEATATCLTTDKQNHFSLSQPNMRLGLIETGTNKRVLVISWHHGILDATSWGLVLDDFYAVYHQQPRSKAYPYKYFVESLFNRTPAHIAEEKSYWKNQFAQLNAVPFPKIGVSEQVKPEMVYLPGSIEIPICNIAQFAQRSRVTIFTLIKAVWAILLRMYTQSEDVTFGYTINGRDGEQEGASSMIGPCINTLACRIHYNGEIPVIEWLQSVHSDHTSSLSYQQSSLRDIQGWTDTAPLFDTLLDYKNSYMIKSRNPTKQSPDGSRNSLELVPLGSNEKSEVFETATILILSMVLS
ncbi:hypothetical protein K7432_016567 [Basidiobolus ranarum]|uniref:Condensation domain-containing protein n=1 Tax=Basidiobolus ranarum TaxID=34480 RepID=A0ABR2VLF6_9FUNG